jgi:hypothetical protein
VNFFSHEIDEKLIKNNVKSAKRLKLSTFAFDGKDSNQEKLLKVLQVHINLYLIKVDRTFMKCSF